MLVVIVAAVPTVVCWAAPPAEGPLVSPILDEARLIFDWIDALMAAGKFPYGEEVWPLYEAMCDFSGYGYTAWAHEMKRVPMIESAKTLIEKARYFGWPGKDIFRPSLIRGVAGAAKLIE